MSDTGAGNAPAPLGAEDDQEPYGPTGPEKDLENTDDFYREPWPNDYDYFGYDVEYGGMYSDHKFYPQYSEDGFLFGEYSEDFSFFPHFRAEEEQEDVESLLYRVPSGATRESEGMAPSSLTTEDPRRRSLFVHSSPMHFPDVNLARKSVFGSIFLRTTGQVAEDALLLRTVADSSYSMLHSLLNSYEKIASSMSSDFEKKQLVAAYKASLLKTLELHGISRLHSDGSIHWNIYPIAHDYLFSVQVGNHIHQTRLLSRIEERIVSGSTQRPRFPYVWPTDSVWTGHWDALGMAGLGTYVMPHGVSYNGKMQNGRFHDDNATLTYPNKFKALHCVFVKGKMISCQFQFPDLLMHEKENWGYCKFPDRRFWSEVRNGLKPAKIAQKTEIDPPRKIPTGCYDTSDGFYNPKSLMLTSPGGELLRVPVCAEDVWIKKYCRKGFPEPADFRPDLFENWYNYDQELIQNILKGQASYRAGKMTYEELQQFYADLNLLPSWSKYKRRKTPSEIELEERLKSIPEPVLLRPPRVEEKYKGHKVPSSVRASLMEDSTEKMHSEAAKLSEMKSQKSFFRFQEGSKNKVYGSQPVIAGKSSKVSIRFTLRDKESSKEALKVGVTRGRRKIPERYLKYQPILKPPFERKTETTSPTFSKKKKCEKSRSPSGPSERSPSLDWGEYLGEAYEREAERKKLRKFMKSIIMDAVMGILIEERERHRRRLKWGRKVPQKPVPREGSTAKCLKVLEELFESIPDKEEYCDSDPKRTCDLKRLAEDKYHMLKYWGKRIYKLRFDERADE